MSKLFLDCNVNFGSVRRFRNACFFHELTFLKIVYVSGILSFDLFLFCFTLCSKKLRLSTLYEIVRLDNDKTHRFLNSRVNGFEQVVSQRRDHGHILCICVF